MIDDVIELTKTDDTLTTHEPLFDIERMKRALKGCESKEEALKNGTLVPEFETIEELHYWTKHVLPTLRTNA